MFYYFGFGSNISMVSLRAKGVQPILSRPASLSGWQLKFNVEHFFRNEGGVANIEYTGNPEDKVLGILHQCPDESLAPLDATEAYGHGYDRIKIDVEVAAADGDNKDTIEAIAYIGMPSFINNNCLPSRRYLNIIIQGAIEAGLDTKYISELKQQPIHNAQAYPPYSPPQGEYPVFNQKTLAQHPLYTALMGCVFDMSNARPHHDYLKQYFGGKDMTLFHLKRLDCSDESETIDDIRHGNLNKKQREYLNSFLNEYNVEYRYVGQFDYHQD